MTPVKVNRQRLSAREVAEWEEIFHDEKSAERALEIATHLFENTLTQIRKRRDTLFSSAAQRFGYSSLDELHDAGMQIRMVKEIGIHEYEIVEKPIGDHA